MAGFGGSTGVSKGYVDGAIAQSTANVNVLIASSFDDLDSKTTAQANESNIFTALVTSNSGAPASENRWVVLGYSNSAGTYKCIIAFTFQRTKLFYRSKANNTWSSWLSTDFVAVT